jgi:hypothetical protein
MMIDAHATQSIVITRRLQSMAVQKPYSSLTASICNLPMELLVMILGQLDIQSLLRCKAVSSITIGAIIISAVLTFNTMQGLSSV